MKLRRKPVVIEGFKVMELVAAKKAAEEMLKEVEEGVSAPKTPWDALPEWLKKAVEEDQIILYPDSADVKVPGGYASAGKEDWILCGTSGEVYPATAESVKFGYEMLP